MDSNYKKGKEDEVAEDILQKIGIAPDKQSIREQQTIFQASELGMYQ